MTTRDIGNLLMDGETVVWSGRSARGLTLTGRDWLLIPFSLIWCGFVIFWETTVLSLKQAPLFFKLFGAAFVLIGLYFVVGRFLLDAWVRSGTQYALTNKRVLIARSWPFAKFTALSLNRLPETSLVEGANGRGTIHFGQSIPFMGSATPTPVGLHRSIPRRRASASKTREACLNRFESADKGDA
jgi:hypothetical protein